MADLANVRGVRLSEATGSVLEDTLPITESLTALPSWSLMKGPEQFIGKHGVCNMPCVPIRTEPSDAAEMDGQLLFGDVFTVIGAERGCLKVVREFGRVGEHDKGSVQGYIDTHLVPAMLIEADEFRLLAAENRYGYVASGSVGVQALDTGEPMRLPFGSVLPHFEATLREGGGVQLDPASTEKARTFSVAGRPFTVADDHAQIFAGPAARTIQNFRRIVRETLGIPYLWGGQSGFGADCSGYTQAVSRILGKVLPRNSGGQRVDGEALDIADATIGSLAFFGPKAVDRVTHVGFLDVTQEGDPVLVHAKQKVKTQRLVRGSDGALMYPESAEFADLKGITDPLALQP